MTGVSSAGFSVALAASSAAPDSSVASAFSPAADGAFAFAALPWAASCARAGCSPPRMMRRATRNAPVDLLGRSVDGLNYVSSFGFWLKFLRLRVGSNPLLPLWEADRRRLPAVDHYRCPELQEDDSAIVAICQALIDRRRSALLSPMAAGSMARCASLPFGPHSPHRSSPERASDAGFCRLAGVAARDLFV